MTWSKLLIKDKFLCLFSILNAEPFTETEVSYLEHIKCLNPVAYALDKLQDKKICIMVTSYYGEYRKKCQEILNIQNTSNDAVIATISLSLFKMRYHRVCGVDKNIICNLPTAVVAVGNSDRKITSAYNIHWKCDDFDFGSGEEDEIKLLNITMLQMLGI